MMIPFGRRPPAPFVGWFGKIPAVGDFAGRGMPRKLQEAAYDWFADGLDGLANSHLGEAWRDAYRVSPVWHFALNAGVWDKRPLIGCLAPSIDRVGRCSPLIAVRSVDAGCIQDVLPPASAWLYEVDALLRRVIAEAMPVGAVLAELERALATGSAPLDGKSSTEEILAELGIIGAAMTPKTWFSWPDLPALFAERTRRSFWWAEPSPSQPARQVIHNGLPDPQLFALLMGGWEQA